MQVNNNRFAQLAALGMSVFHAGDMANLWHITNQNTLSKTLSRYASSGMIYRIHKGFYSIKKPSDLDPYLVGIKALHGPAYVSCESVLFDNGIINQSPQEITLVGRASKRFAIAGHRFRARKLRDIFLLNDIGITTKNGVRVASLDRAVADMLYFNPKKYFDALNPRLLDNAKKITDAIGY